MNVMAESLIEALDSICSVPGTSEQQARFEVNSLETAAWVMRKLAHIRGKQSEIQGIADKEIARVQNWADEQKKSLGDDAQFFEGLLVTYHHKVLEGDPKAKTVKLPHGQLTARQQPDDWKIIDEAFIRSLKDAGRLDLIRVKEEPKRDEARKALTVDGGRVIDPETGGVIEGVTVIPGGVKFSVKVGE